MNEPKNIKLQDVLNYDIETHLTPEEMHLIHTTFSDNRVLKVLRKVMLPSVGDLELSPEEFNKDVWLNGRDYSMIPDAEIKSIVLARQEAIKFVMGGLINLKVMANSKTETSMEKALRERKNSSK